MEKPRYQTFICFTSILCFFSPKAERSAKPCITAPHVCSFEKISIGMSPCRDKSGNCCNALLN